MPSVGDSPRMQALKKLSGNMPVQNQQVAQGLQQARMLGLQQQVAQAPTGVGVRAAQQAGAQQAQQAGQIAQQAAQQAQTQQVQVGQLGLQERGRQQRAAQAAGELDLGRQELDFSDKLNEMGQDIKKQLFDKEMQFKKDELGRTTFNNRQMVDWTITKVKSMEEFKNYEQLARQEFERKQQIMDTAHKKVMQVLEQEFRKAEQEKDQESKKKITQMIAAAKEAEKRRQARERSKAAAWQAGGQMVGAVIGGIAGGGAGGAMIGSQIGGGLGTMAYSQFG